MQVLGPWTDSSTIAAVGGGKVRGLHTLNSSGLQVPEWVALGTDAFDEFVVAAGLADRVVTYAALDDVDAAVSAGAELQALIAEASLPERVRELVGEAYGKIGGAVAVRSSAVGEDGRSHSYAGQFDSFLNVNGIEAVEPLVRQCWASAFAERAIRYACARGERPTTAVAVVLQRLVDARASGVVFTVNPATGATDELVVSAVYGLGEGVVSGAVDADSIVVDEVGTVRERIIGGKESAYRPAGDQGSEPTEVEQGQREDAVLTATETIELAEQCSALARKLDAAQDIEWAIDDSGLWFLQTRPITTVAPGQPPDPVVAEAATIRGAGEDVPAGELRIWDNSNIIESFNGITSPLTYTTAADIYGRVYRGYAESLRVPAKQLAQTDRWTSVLLGYFHGHVYYNLLQWYRMVGIAPGYSLNRRVLEAALGVAEPLPKDIATTLRPFTFDSSVGRLRSRAVTTVTYLRRLFGIDAMVDEFLGEFYRVYRVYEATDDAALTGPQAYEAYRKFEGELVERWGPLMVLDAILLTCTGLLFVLTKLLLPKAPEWFLYAVVGPGSDVESAEPARAMTALAETIRGEPELAEIVNSTAPEQVYQTAREAGYAAFCAEVDTYIDNYGYRSLDELKLETPDLREDPASLFVMLRSALGRVGDADRAGTDELVPPDRAAAADAYLGQHLGSGVRRRIYERLRAKVSRCAAHRERLRFCRTRAFGMVKRMIRVMARDLVARDVIDEFDDVFSLTVQELRGCYADNDQHNDVRPLIAARKARRTSDADLVAPARFTTYGATFTADELTAQGWVPRTDTPAATAGAVLAGTPSAAGVVEGMAVVVDEPRDVAGGILIAYRTDPGWVAALPVASALVIERGSPLTHVAIVARELGVPTVVQVADATAKLRTGMEIRVDGASGTVTVLGERVDR